MLAIGTRVIPKDYFICFATRQRVHGSLRLGLLIGMLERDEVVLQFVAMIVLKSESDLICALTTN
jgi:hypothetical protein